MATIQQGSQPRDHLGLDPSQMGVDPSQKKDKVKEEAVGRGFSGENSVSTNEKRKVADSAANARPNLDAPEKGSDSPSLKVLKELSVLKEMESSVKPAPAKSDPNAAKFDPNAAKSDPNAAKSDPNAAKFDPNIATSGFDGATFDLGGAKLDPGVAKSELLAEFLRGLDLSEDGALNRPNPLARHISSMQNNRDHLLSLGYSEEVIDGMLALANPDDLKNSLAKMHSFSARLGARISGDSSLGKLNDLYADTLNKVANLKGGPADLHAELQTDLKKFIDRFQGSDKTLDVDTATQMLMSIQTKLQNNRLLFNQQNIKIGQVEREQISEKRMNKILESIEKAKEAQKAGAIGKIFGYIALAIMAVVTVVMFATGVGGPIAMGLMVAALALTITMTVSAETGDWMNKAIASVLESFGMDKDEAMIGAMVFWSAVMLVLSIGGAAASGLASAGGTAAKAGATGASAAASGTAAATVTAEVTTAATTATRIGRMAVMAARFTRVARVVGGAATMADGSANAASTTLKYEADIARADAKELFAWMLRNQAAIDDMVEDIKKVIEDLQQTWQVMTGIMKDNHETNTKLIGAIKG